MRELFINWKEQFFTEPLLTITLYVTLIIALKNKGKYIILRLLPYYIISFIALDIFSIAWYISGVKIFKHIGNYFDYLFTLIELVLFSAFFYRLIPTLAIRRFVVVANLIFFAFFVYVLFENWTHSFKISSKTQSSVYTIEGIILLLISVLYFIGLFRNTTRSMLKNDPSFWVSTGLLLFLVCTLPYSIAENYISDHHFTILAPLYSIFYLFYTLFFLLIIRAYLCRPERSG